MDEKPAVRLKEPRKTEVPMKDLKARLDRFETKHGLSSEAFYRRAHAGLLDEQEDYIAWLGYYEAYLRIRGKGQDRHHHAP